MTGLKIAVSPLPWPANRGWRGSLLAVDKRKKIIKRKE